MAALVDPFDDPDFVPGQSRKPHQPMVEDGGIIDPFDDPDFMPMADSTPLPDPQPMTMGDKVAGFADIASDLVTGEGRIEFPDAPNIDQIEFPYAGIRDLPRITRTAAGMLFSMDDQQKMDIISKAFPEAQFSQDSFGNVMITIDGQTGYINKPGIRRQDLLQFGSMVGPYYKTGKAALSAFMPKRLFTRAATVGGAAGVTQGAQDLGAHALGAEKLVDVPRAATAAAVGGGFEMLSPIASAAWRALRSRGGTIAADGTITVDGQKVLREAGIDISEVADEVQAMALEMIKEGAEPTDAVRMAQAQSLPVPVRQTRGMATLNPDEQLAERAAMAGNYGETARDLMKGAYAQADDQLRANADEIQRQIGGGQVQAQGDAGRMVQSKLLEKQAGAKQATNRAYEAAENTTAQLRTEGLSGLAESVRKPAERILRNAPEAATYADDLSALASAENPLTDVQALFDWRRNLSAFANNAPNRTEALAAKEMLRSFDGGVEGVVKDLLMEGNEKAADKWLKAIATRRSMGRIYENGGIIGDLLEREVAGDAGTRLKVSPEQASNLIFGASNNGLVTRPQMVRELKTLRKRLGATSSEWNAVREEAFLRLVKNADGAMSGEGRGFSGAKLLKAWQELQKRNPDIVETLFDPPERDLITQFAEVANRTTTPVRGGSNPSGTANALINYTRQMMNSLMIGEKGTALLSRLFPPVYDFVQSGRLNINARSPLPLSQVPAGATGAVGAAATANER